MKSVFEASVKGHTFIREFILIFFPDKNERINIDVDNSKASEIFSMFQHVAEASER